MIGRSPEAASAHHRALMFTSFILKLTGYCNLNCSYCYMFNSADQGFARKPTSMMPETAEAAVAAIGTHARRHGIDAVAIALHGGEPTLWPLEHFLRLFDAIAALRASGIAVDLAMQTNMFKLPSTQLLDALAAAGGKLGISLDGPAQFNDAARVDFADHGSHDRIVSNVRQLIADGHGDLIGGFLSVMQPDIAPDEYLEWLAALPVTRATLLWPLEPNQITPPWQDQQLYAVSPRYGTWLTEVFDCWVERDSLDLQIRFFDETMQSLLGGPPQRDDIGPWAFHSAVINTDGAIELTDYLRTAADGAGETGFNVVQHTLDDVADSLDFRARKLAAEQQPVRCGRCPYWQACRGGTLSGRLDGQGRITDQPSVLCHDHLHFYGHVAARLAEAEAA